MGGRLTHLFTKGHGAEANGRDPQIAAAQDAQRIGRGK
jgi:hypothetical protein